MYTGKKLTIAVPSYNSEQYLDRCLDSLVVGGKDVEVIVVDDGSTDNTGAIADGYRDRYPDIVKVIHKENGGHGSGVNAGLAAATGEYFKVVDSDDWFDEDSYMKLLDAIGGFQEKEDEPDLIICNYTYNHLDEGKTRTINYRNVFPVEQMCGWNDIKFFKPSQYLIMHALVYRTEMLKECGVVLPKHTFYVDNIFAYYPLPYAKKLYYMDMPLYQYYLGRPDQSVNEQVMISRIEQQIRVTKIIAECVDLNKVKAQSPKLAEYMCRNVSIMMAISSIHLLLAGDALALARFHALWTDMKQEHRALYYRLRYTKLSGFTNLPGHLGKKITIGGYRIAKKIYKFQ